MTHATTNRTRSAGTAQAIADFTKTLHEGQPLVAAGATFLCNGYFGNVRLDLYGSCQRLRSGFVVDLDDAAIAGTQISLLDSLNGQQWQELHEQAQIALEEAA
ncbi:hypothetical protein ACSI5F_03765 [Ralstonia pseudosolanacearum]|uniref:hypothetical protein n=1 Tax=Ralstonia pseudosolanacearum TaxID=1310165 RepID=UPI003EE34E31